MATSSDGEQSGAPQSPIPPKTSLNVATHQTPATTLNTIHPTITVSTIPPEDWQSLTSIWMLQLKSDFFFPPHHFVEVFPLSLLILLTGSCTLSSIETMKFRSSQSLGWLLSMDHRGQYEEVLKDGKCWDQ
ncbi:hypothetical protein L1887_27701 [Cichorium endivia]|nr:hypothetical protein L1887_27701 [Cichorium endivia]